MLRAPWCFAVTLIRLGQFPSDTVFLLALPLAPWLPLVWPTRPRLRGGTPLRGRYLVRFI